MPAYFRESVLAFLAMPSPQIVGMLEEAHARDGYSGQFSLQTVAWAESVPLLQESLRVAGVPCTILLEYPLYRLRRRIDAVVLVGSSILVVEAKVGATQFTAADRRQVEEYALDLRDFHEASSARRIVPVLWCTGAPLGTGRAERADALPACGVGSVCDVGAEGIGKLLVSCYAPGSSADIEPVSWDHSSYRPVPSVIQAATHIFAGHDVRELANADASNLRDACRRLIDVIATARRNRSRCVAFLTGVPGSGKTLAGLQVVHEAIATGTEDRGDIIYLSGNTPLVTVLREALARDEHQRARAIGTAVRIEEVRRAVRARIQHISDFLRESLAAAEAPPPHEHVIVFDEAQRAWNEAQGKKKFDRADSEPSLLLEIMGRHPDWCVCICLVGGGQEINAGEDGIEGWGNALRKESALGRSWIVYGPPDMFDGGASTGGLAIGQLPDSVECFNEPSLQLVVPQRSYRSPRVSDWVNQVILGDQEAAAKISADLGAYPIRITRSLTTARNWLNLSARGHRRSGLLASSGARRLRAEGLGSTLPASAGDEIAHWYLNRLGDIRASYALEVPANEYTAQGLELDFSGVCWDGDFYWVASEERWEVRALSGPRWQIVRNYEARRHVENSYRVLLTRAREGMVLWVPLGNSEDETRRPSFFDETAAFLT